MTNLVPWFRNGQVWLHGRCLGVWLSVLLGVSGAGIPKANAVAELSRVDVGGYARTMIRPDFQGGGGKLGYSTLYGRLLNEGAYAALELKVGLLEERPNTMELWSALHFKVEGGSLASIDSGDGTLANYRGSQLYVKAGNLLFKDVTWQLGTLESYEDDLALYDYRLGQLFLRTAGLSVRYQPGPIEFLVGVGDAGFGYKGSSYSTIINSGFALRAFVGDWLSFGVGGEYRLEPEVQGNKYAPHFTEGLSYAEYARGEVLQRYFDINPDAQDLFKKPTPTTFHSFKLVFQAGLFGLGAIKWNNFFLNYEKLHPDNVTTETYKGEAYDIYIGQLTDERYQINVGNELHVSLVARRLDVLWGAVFGWHVDKDNELVPSDRDRTFYSTVIRFQGYVSETLHLLGEGSYANERSHNGNMYRLHADSVFQSSNGVADSLGFEFGDSDTRETWQVKVGVVLSPVGLGIFSRPALRLLYGAQYSTQTNAFGNNFAETLDQYNEFPTQDRHWHHVLSLEAEVWF